MNYDEASQLIASHIEAAKANKFFLHNNKECRFMAFIIAPENDDLETKREIFNNSIKQDFDNRYILKELGILNENLGVFYIYKYIDEADQFIIPFESYLTDFIKAT